MVIIITGNKNSNYKRYGFTDVQMARQKKITQYEFDKTAKSFESYIGENDINLSADEYMIVHLDGIGFTHKYYRNFSSEIKGKVIYELAKSAKEICSEISHIRIAYACSDEVSFILDGKAISAKDDKRLNKVISKFASLLTLKFYRNMTSLNLKDIADFLNKAIFSAKAYDLPASLTEQYLKWRLMGCKKLIFDRKENYEEKENWEKFGYLICKNGTWKIKCVDFEKGSLNMSSPYMTFTFNKQTRKLNHATATINGHK